MQIMMNQPNPQPVAQVIATVRTIVGALSSPANVVSVTYFPNGATITEEAVVIVGDRPVTLKHHGALFAWEIIAPDGRYVVTDADADPITDAVRRVMMPFD